MNQQQIRYAKNRAEQIFKEKDAALQKKYRTPAKVLTEKEKYDQIKKGVAALKPYDDTRRMYYVTDMFVFKGEEAGKFDGGAYQKGADALRSKFNKLMDELMLGDNEEALKMLKAFEAL